MFSSDSLPAQVSALGGLILVTLFVAIHPWSRTLVAQLAQMVARLLRLISSSVAMLLDLAIPINPKNGRIPPVRFALWVSFNVSVVVAWLYTRWHASPPDTLNVVGAINFTLALVNLMFLVGAYWALREGIAIMNGDQSYRRHQFADLSTAKNAVMVCAASILIILQIAGVLQWLQDIHNIQLITVRRTLGVAYMDFLVATANALPFLSLYVGLPGLSDHVAFTPGIGSWCFKALNALGSVLLVSTIIGFVQQHLAFRKMIDDLLTKSDTKILPLLKERFLRAPSAIKSYVRAAFQSETDDGKLLKLIQLAVAKHSYSFPAIFIRSYSSLSETLKQEGTPVVANFVERKGHQFDSEALLGITRAANAAYLAGVLSKREDRQRIGTVILPCIEQLCDSNRYDPSIVRRAIQTARQKPFQLMLCALLSAGVDEKRQERAAELLIKSRAQDLIAEILRCLQHMNDRSRVRVLQGVRQLLLDRGLTFALSADSDPLGEVVRTADWNIHNIKFSSASDAALKQVRAAAVERRAAKKRAKAVSPLKVSGAQSKEAPGAT